MTTLNNIKKTIDSLPSEDLSKVENFINEIITKNQKAKKKKMKLNLRGSLKGLKTKYTSVELQHKATEWMFKDSLSKNKKKK